MPADFDSIQLSYLAGIFDGEGWVTIYTAKGRKPGHAPIRFTLQIGVANAYLPVLVELQDLFGGCVETAGKPVNMQVYRWVAPSKLAWTFLRCIRPYLRIKALQADIAIEFYEQCRNVQGVKVSAEELDRRLSYKKRLRETRCGQQPN
jgi:hypothetical protein